MSKVLGIVAEYNPFHNGHLYHLNKSKKLTGADYTIAIIGGSFTQRGSTSLIDKWSKAKMSLLNGVDLVIELPVLYATSSAENFADGAIKILNSLNIVDYISFGAETSNVAILDKFADVLYNEPKEYQNLLAHELKKGISFPKARENALLMYINDIRNSVNVLSSPVIVETILSEIKLIIPSLSAFTLARTALNVLFFVLCSLIHEEITVVISASAQGTVK